MGELRTLNQRVRGSSPWRRTIPAGHTVSAQMAAKIKGHFSDTFRSRLVGPHQLFEYVPALPVGQLASEVAILGHADLGVPKLVADLAGGHVGVVEKVGHGLAEHVADQPLHLGLVADSPPYTSHVRWIAPAAERVR